MATLAVVPEVKPSRSRGLAGAVKLATIDQAAKDFLALNLCLADLEAQIDEAKDKLLDLVKKHGKVPAKAEKSKRLCGEMYSLTATYGTSTSVDTQAAERVMLAMIDAGMDKKTAVDLFEQLFTFAPKYSLAGNALKTISGKFPKGTPRNLRFLFSQAVKVTDKKPTLKVEEIK